MNGPRITKAALEAVAVAAFEPILSNRRTPAGTFDHSPMLPVLAASSDLRRARLQHVADSDGDPPDHVGIPLMVVGRNEAGEEVYVRSDDATWPELAAGVLLAARAYLASTWTCDPQDEFDVDQLDQDRSYFATLSIGAERLWKRMKLGATYGQAFQALVLEQAGG